MEVGVIVEYGSVIPGKEQAAVDLFAETMKLYGDQMAKKTFTYFEPFVFRTGDWQEDLGFYILKGPEDKVMAFFDSVESKTLRAKASLIVNHLKIDYLYAGTDVMEQVALLSKVVEQKVPAGIR